MMRPLAGLKVVEFEGIGPGPLAGRMLADLGAEVVAIVRADKAALGDPGPPLVGWSAAARQAYRRSRSQAPQAVSEALTMIETADALIEGNRPGVMERLGSVPPTAPGAIRGSSMGA